MDAIIGQKDNIETIINWRFNKNIPHFILIQGYVGSGRYTLAEQIVKLLHVKPTVCETGKDDIRDVINTAYTVYDTQCFIFRDIDNMSDGAKNALLKIVEEPSANCYFIMTVEDFNNIPSTIVSRAFTLWMQLYTEEDLSNFTDDKLILRYCYTPGQILYWKDKNFKEFIQFCKNSANTIYDGTGVKSLQISNSIKVKPDDEGYDALFTVQTIARMLIDKLELSKISPTAYLEFIRRTSETTRLLKNKSIKKDSCVDDYILWVRDFLDATVN